MWRKLDFAAMDASVGEKDAVLLLVASCGRCGPDARDPGATAFEDKVCTLLEGENLENGIAALSCSVLVRVELAWSAAGVAFDDRGPGAGASENAVGYG